MNMSNIIKFPNKNNLRFVVRATTIEVFKDKFKQPVMKKHSIICLQNQDNGKEVVHPITDFIFSYWKQTEYNTMANASFKTVALLNWLYFDGKETINDLSKIKTVQIIQFLYSLTEKGNTRDTVKSYERVIIKFLSYLSYKEILNPNFNLEKFKIELQSSMIYNNRKKYDRIHEFKNELIIPFLELAFKERNPIALGVYYQIFGGLRAGEVVNLAKTDIKNIGSFGEFGQILDIHPNSFRSDIKTTSGKGEIKVNRRQVVFPYKHLLKKLYKAHIQNYKATDGTTALFVDSNGKAMTGDTYNYHFRQLKKIFIETLSKDKDIRLVTYAKYLEDMKWGTHIGRGLYSNVMAEYAENPLELAVARGDYNLNSSLTYIADTERIIRKIQDELELLYEGDFLD